MEFFAEAYRDSNERNHPEGNDSKGGAERRIREALANVKEKLGEFQQAEFDLAFLVYEAGSRDLESFHAAMKEILSAGNPGYHERTAEFLFHRAAYAFRTRRSGSE